MALTATIPPSVEDMSLSTEAIHANTRTSRTGTKRKIICFSDFDGTIFKQDTGHILFNTFGCGPERRQLLDQQIRTGERSFRHVSEDMWGSLDVPFDSGLQVMKQSLDIDVGFRTFHRFCIDNEIPFNVISAGLKPVLRRILDHFLGEEEARRIDIVANDATVSADGREWKPVWRDDSAQGHDKAKSINDYRHEARLQSADGTIPLIVFVGDGVSDLPAAREADVLFARRGLALEEHCVAKGIAYVAFDTFADVQREVARIAGVDHEVSDCNPRADMWRRASSKSSLSVFAAATPCREEEKMCGWPEAFAQGEAQVEAQVGAPVA